MSKVRMTIKIVVAVKLIRVCVCVDEGHVGRLFPCGMLC